MCLATNTAFSTAYVTPRCSHATKLRAMECREQWSTAAERNAVLDSKTEWRNWATLGVLNPGGVETARGRKQNPGQAGGMEALDLPGTRLCRLPLKEGNWLSTLVSHGGGSQNDTVTRTPTKQRRPAHTAKAMGKLSSPQQPVRGDHPHHWCGPGLGPRSGHTSRFPYFLSFPSSLAQPLGQVLISSS